MKQQKQPKTYSVHANNKGGKTKELWCLCVSTDSVSN